MGSGVRQDSRELTKTIQNLEKRIADLEKRRVNQIKLIPSSSYDSTDIQRIVDKINEIAKILS